MQSTIVKNRKGSDIYKLEFTFIEMHIIMQAMAAYSHQGFQQRGTPSNSINEAHIKAAEELHDEMIDVYTNN